METLLTYWGQLVGVWNGLDYQIRYYAWLASGVALLFYILTWWYPFMRRQLGQRKHRGTWYNEQQYAELMQILDETSKVRVLQNVDMIALRQWKHGDVQSLSGDKAYGGYM